MSKYNVLGDQHLSPKPRFCIFLLALFASKARLLCPKIYLTVILKKETPKEIRKETSVPFLPDVFVFFKKIRERAYANDASIWFEEGAR